MSERVSWECEAAATVRMKVASSATRMMASCALVPLDSL